MEMIGDFYISHAFWVWMGVAAVLLAIEVSTGTGWLLWPSASAAVVGVLTLVAAGMGFTVEVLLFALLTIVSTLLAHRFLPKRIEPTEDLNDRAATLVGMVGLTVSPFREGRGRVMVNGSEWAAELVEGEAPPTGTRVEVVNILGGARIAVRRAPAHA